MLDLYAAVLEYSAIECADDAHVFCFVCLFWLSILVRTCELIIALS